LTLTNVSGRPRRLTVAAYVEWVLGASRSVTAPYIITEPGTGKPVPIFAYNPRDMEFGQRVSPLPISAARQSGWTAIGPNLSPA